MNHRLQGSQVSKARPGAPIGLFIGLGLFTLFGIDTFWICGLGSLGSLQR
jgi:hypothetical protein